MKLLAIILLILSLAAAIYVYMHPYFKFEKSYRHFGQVGRSSVTVEQIREKNPAINQVLSKIVHTDYFKIFRGDMWKDCKIWDLPAKCGRDQCTVIEEDDVKNSTHIKAYKIISDLNTEEVEFTHHIPIEEYETSVANNRWMDDSYSDEDAYFIDLTKNPERFSGYNGSAIWYEIYENNLFKMNSINK